MTSAIGFPNLPACWRLDVEAEEQRAFGQAPIVRYDRIQVRCDQLGRSEMHGVEGTQDARIEHAGRVEQAVVEADEVDTAQNAPRTIHGRGSQVANRPQDLRACEGARHPLVPGAQEPPQGR